MTNTSFTGSEINAESLNTNSPMPNRSALRYVVLEKTIYHKAL